MCALSLFSTIPIPRPAHLFWRVLPLRRSSVPAPAGPRSPGAELWRAGAAKTDVVDGGIGVIPAAEG
jgi:hypothetical protein